jgi:hypothetical protein
VILKPGGENGGLLRVQTLPEPGLYWVVYHVWLDGCVDGGCSMAGPFRLCPEFVEVVEP